MYIKKFNEDWSPFKKSTKTSNFSNKPSENTSDEKEVRSIFHDIKSNYNESSLSRYDSGLYGYYFRYEVDNDTKLEIGMRSTRLSKNKSNFTLVNVSQSLIDEMLDFFESKDKGSIR